MQCMQTNAYWLIKKRAAPNRSNSLQSYRYMTLMFNVIKYDKPLLFLLLNNQPGIED